MRVAETEFAPAAGLFPSPAERERDDDRLTRTLLAAADRVAKGSVQPTLDLAAFRHELAGVRLRRTPAARRVGVVGRRRRWSAASPT